SRVWSVFFQQPYVLSVAYQASPVLVEPDDPVAGGLSVRAANLYALPMRRRTVERVVAQAGPDAPILPESPVSLQGAALGRAGVPVRVGGQGVAPDWVGDWRIDVKLPAGLRAGVLGAQARYPLRIGSPPALHPGFDSNVAPFVLHPVITKTGANYDV